MRFLQFNELIKKQFEKMCATGQLFKVDAKVVDTYLGGFSREEDPIFRDPNSSTHNCNNDKNFLKRYGNIIAFDAEFNVMCLFDVDVQGTIFENTVEGLKRVLKNSRVIGPFQETFEELNNLPYQKINKQQSDYQLGMAVSHKKYSEEEVAKFGRVNSDEVYVFNHFHVFLPTKFVSKTNESAESILGKQQSTYQVFERGVREISLDTLELVQDLIVQKSILDAEPYLGKVRAMIAYKKEYLTIPDNKKANWCWVISQNTPVRFRNELIGVLCVELSEGVELNKACENWNRRIDPVNYMKVKPYFSQKQLEKTNAYLLENGYETSFERRYATKEDIRMSEILHFNSGELENKLTLFENVTPSKTSQHKKSQFDGVQEVNVEDFMKNILPNCSSVEVFVENRFKNKFVAMTTAKENSKPLLKWGNNYSWTYFNNLAGESRIAQSVKAAGGNIQGIMRGSLAWAHDKKDRSDLDLHVVTPKDVIYFRVKNQETKTGGILDVDIRDPRIHGFQNIVENTVWADNSKLVNGQYVFQINQYSAHDSSGFKFELLVDGQLFHYEYKQPVRGVVDVATVTYNNGAFTIKHHLPFSESAESTKIWGIETGKFHPVSLVCLSPNHWDDKVGNKQYFFMLKNCVPDSELRGFHVENLNSELLQFKRELEALAGAKTIPVTQDKNCLAGVGFNATVSDEVILQLNGTHKRTIKLKF